MPSDRILIRCKKNNLFVSKLNARRNFWWNKVLPLTFRYFVRSSFDCYVTAMIGSQVDRLLVLKAFSMCWACHYQTNFLCYSFDKEHRLLINFNCRPLFLQSDDAIEDAKNIQIRSGNEPATITFGSVLKTVLTLHWPQKLTRKVFLALLEASCRKWLNSSTVW